MTATSPQLNTPLRSEAEARAQMFERNDKYHRKALGVMLEREGQARLQYLNSAGPLGYLETYNVNISALNYALEALTKATAERIKGQSALKVQGPET